MKLKEQISQILLTKLNSIINPKFHNKFILLLLTAGLGLLTPSILSVLVKFQLITDGFVINIEAGEATNSTLALIGLALVSMSVYLLRLVRKQEHEVYMYEESLDHDFSVNYYICEDFDHLKELCSGDLTNFPEDKAMLLNNDVLDTINSIISSHPDKHRCTSHFTTEDFGSEEKYKSLYPHASKPNKAQAKHAYFSLVRELDENDKKFLYAKDSITKLMINSSFSGQLGYAGAYPNECWDVEFQEELVVRKLWVLFLSIKNNSNKLVDLDSLLIDFNNKNEFYDFKLNPEQKKVLTLPKIMLEPGKCVVIPVSILVPPLTPLSRKKIVQHHEDSYGEKVYEVFEESIKLEEDQTFFVYGEQWNVKRLNYQKGGRSFSTDIRCFEPTNTFTLNVGWQIGSCPHLFCIKADKIVYERELLASCVSNVGEDLFVVPSSVSRLVIAEIEDEITTIKCLSVNGNALVHDLTLKKGDAYEFNVNEGDVVEIVGLYEPYLSQMSNIPVGNKRNDLICNYIRGYNRKG
ncbi:MULTISPECIES: hypothetical protein [Vibrio]|uniref:Uncharacterized protein n=1 Tax=Vibrio tasmaniensis TaxID=212663 RepID=A0A2N7NCF1_9VIBR|nr:hypothetical protein [Vibrio tasmaniensis]PMP09323.1 hypothetical protein BCS92_23925 [Vibrio tasmaniensis]TKG26453.1 hypothetical protein FC057_24425 [Vibrio tasmaniensis]TKG35629.1 hypothetical protein FC063_24690 [Vibrio tasmaniensis]TKG40567.1 hypothetical protein FC061_24285 [Vibrio tasmaniensis]TKG40576.1 hypothetical protein FC060_23770 [Vibrio tasmaniensis]